MLSTLDNNRTRQRLSGFTFPVPGGMIVLGDSRTQQGGGVITTSQQTSSFNTGGSVSGWFESAIGNKSLFPLGWNYGVTGSTSLNLQVRNTSASIASTGNPASAAPPAGTGNGSDASYSVVSDGAYSPVGHPANVVVILDGVNDPSSSSYYTSPLKTMQVQKQILDDLTNLPASPKAIFLANELPRGNTAVSQELHTVTAGTFTATNTTGFADSRLWGEASAQDNLGNPLTYVSGTPATGQYSVTSAGVYTFNTGAGTVPPSAFVTYAYGTVTTSTYQRVIHEWQSSNAATFIDSQSPFTNYGVPGALYNRNNVVSVDTWGAIKDPASTVAVPYALAGLFDSAQLHNNVLGGFLVSKAMATAFATTYPTAVSTAQAPTLNNWRAIRGAGGTTAFSGTLPPSMRFASYVPTQLRMDASVIATVASNGAISGAGITGTLTFATGAFSVTFTTAPTTFIFFEQDFTNIAENGLMDTFTASGGQITTLNGTSSVTGVASTAIPNGYTLSGSANINTAITAGTLSVSVGYGTNRNGFTSFRVIVSGVGPSGGSQIKLTSGPIQTRFAGNLSYRAGVERLIGAGTNGWLYGLIGADLTTYVQSSVSSSRPTPSGTNQNVIFATGKAMSGAAGQPWGSAVLVANGGTAGSGNGALSQQLVTPPFNTAGFTVNGNGNTMTIYLEDSKPVSAAVEYSQLHIRQRTD